LIHQAIARRYAKGLFEVGVKDGKYKEYFQQMNTILDFFAAEAKIEKALMLPLLEIDRRKDILSDVLKMLGISAPLSNLMTMILEKNRTNYLSMIRDQYRDLVDEKEGRIRGTLWSPFPIDEDLKAQVEAAFKETMAKDVILNTVVDSSLIGGLKVQIRGTIIDGSVKRQLETLKENILKE